VSEPPCIGIVAGEPSGDALGAALIEAVAARVPGVRFAGIGGARMQSAGCEIWHPLDKLAVRGLVEVLPRIPELAAVRRDVYRRLRSIRAPLFIGIDAPDFNLGLERRLKRQGVRTIHYVSPSVWAWRPQRVRTIAGAAHRLLALFPFEPALYADTALAVDFVGHPLAANAADAGSRREVRELLKLETSRPMFALLPGSRMGEVEMHAELVLQTAVQILEAMPEARFIVPLASREARNHVETVLYRLGLEALPLTLLYGHADHALKAADVGVIASGTATLEAAMSRCPHIIFYRLNPVTAGIVRSRLLLPYVGLPNILAGRYVVAEFLQEEASASNLARAALNLYDDTVTRRRLEALFAGMARSLSADSAARIGDAVTAELRLGGVTC
jgi:lipid-A-disaccharide synthase